MYGKKTVMSLAIKSKPDRSQYVDLLRKSVCYSLIVCFIISYAKRMSSVLRQKSGVLYYSQECRLMSLSLSAYKQTQKGEDLLKPLRRKRINKRLRATLDTYQSAPSENGKMMRVKKYRQ